MDETSAKKILDEAVASHLATDEGQTFLEAWGQEMEVHSILETTDPQADKDLKHKILQYMWEQIPVSAMQTHLRFLYAAFTPLRELASYEVIRPFLEFDIIGALNQGGEGGNEAHAKTLFHEAWGILTQPAPLGIDPVGNAEGIEKVWQDIETYLEENHPGKWEEFMRIGLGEFREGRKFSGEEVKESRVQLEEMLGDEPDLLRRFKEVCPQLEGEEKSE